MPNLENRKFTIYLQGRNDSFSIEAADIVPCDFHGLKGFQFRNSDGSLNQDCFIAQDALSAYRITKLSVDEEMEQDKYKRHDETDFEDTLDEIGKGISC